MVQQETDPPSTTTYSSCPSVLADRTGEWADVVTDFKLQNRRVRVLQPALTMSVPYRLIHRGDIDHPGMWSPSGKWPEYAAVSAVGFDRARTKAIVHVHLRGQGFIERLELKDGQRTLTSLCGPAATSCRLPPRRYRHAFHDQPQRERHLEHQHG